MNKIKRYTLKKIINNASQKSPFYGKLYQKNGALPFQNLPLIEQPAFWKANTLEDNSLLCGPIQGGIVFKSGGTTGNPKFSVYTRKEWEAMTTDFARGLAQNGIKKGDRIANLFYVGELYSSFLFLHEALAHCQVETINFPIAGSAPIEFIMHALQELQINVILGVPTSLMAMADFIERNSLSGLCVQKIHFGGETMYPDQRRRVADIFGGAKIRSVGYASVDAGLLGFADDSCGFNEHRAFMGHNIIEVIDEESGKPIEEMGRPGKLYSTNLTRLLMPIIRYPIGDLGMWTEKARRGDRKFKILGRSEEGARIGPVTVYVEDIMRIISELKKSVEISNFQIVIARNGGLDQLVLKLATSAGVSRKDVDSDFISMLYAQRAMLKMELDRGHIASPRIEWCAASDMEKNSRTGKIRRIIDRRLE